MPEQNGASFRHADIHDLGYRPYQGSRLGRLYALESLFSYSGRAVFGLGRGWVAKLFALGLAGIAMIPALVQLAIAALVPTEFELVSFESYFGFVGIVVALFCSVTAPEVVSKDQYHHTLTLYFSRALSRVDYVTAKAAALIFGLLLIQVVPQLFLLTGNAVATEMPSTYLSQNIDQMPPILGSALIIAAMMGSVSLAIACQTPRRYLASGAVMAYFVIATVLGSGLQEAFASREGDYAFLISPLHVLEGVTYWVFNSTPGLNSDIHDVSFASYYYFLASIGYTILGLAVLYRRFLKLSI